MAMARTFSTLQSVASALDADCDLAGNTYAACGQTGQVERPAPGFIAVVVLKPRMARGTDVSGGDPGCDLAVPRTVACGTAIDEPYVEPALIGVDPKSIARGKWLLAVTTAAMPPYARSIKRNDPPLRLGL